MLILLPPHYNENGIKNQYSRFGIFFRYAENDIKLIYIENGIMNQRIRSPGLTLLRVRHSDSLRKIRLEPRISLLAAKEGWRNHPSNM